MRRIVISLVCLVGVLGACGSDKKEVTAAATTSTAASTTTATAAPTAAPTVTTAETTTSVAATTTSAEACPNTGSTDPRESGAHSTALLTKVAVTNSDCRDSVTFTFKKHGVESPDCKVSYRDGPFTKDPSDMPLPVAGTAFVVVRCAASGTDFETGATVYTGPKRIAATGTRHVREVVQMGDFESVLNWVIGLDEQRAFAITAGGTPERQLIVTFS